ncbi:hypothetical protein KJ885_05610 [Patescibacteria group bacterium]|nr:hypothetical protein [Patescibacteria group bacterium]
MDMKFVMQYPLVAWEGIKLFGGIPSLPKLRVKNVEKTETVMRINMQYWSSHYKSWLDCHIWIDLENEEIIWQSTDDWLFNKEYKGSGIIEVVVFTLPVTIPLLPILLGINGCYRFAEKSRGISRHSHALLKTLKGQLDPETEEILIRAMKNMWERDVYFSQQVSFEEAKALLGQCHLRDLRITGHINEECHYYRQLHWFDESEIHVGFADIANGELRQDVKVLGSFFEGEEAKALFECYKTKEVVDWDERRRQRKEARESGGLPVHEPKD